MLLREAIVLKGLFVDDERPLPNTPTIDWDLARTYDDAIAKLDTTRYDIVSLDHDLGCFNADGREMTGYDVALYLADRRHNGHPVPDIVKCHSANPAGRQRIEGVIARYL